MAERDSPDTAPSPFAIPKQACDADVRLTGPLTLFEGEPESDWIAEKTLADLQGHLAGLGFARAVLVQPALFGGDHTCMLQALAQHRNTLRGVAAIGTDLDDDTLETMAHTGIRGIRLDARSKEGLSPAAIEMLASRIELLGWHIQLAIDPPALKRLAPFLGTLPVDIVVEDMGLASVAEEIDGPGFKALLKLVRLGRTWVKLTGAVRLSASPPPWRDMAGFAHALAAADPTRLLWGSGWPHEAVPGRLPSDGDLIDLLGLMAPDERLRHLILVKNPARLYRFGE